MFEAESIADATDAQIKNSMSTFDDINSALELINSADGLQTEAAYVILVTVLRLHKKHLHFLESLAFFALEKCILQW